MAKRLVCAACGTRVIWAVTAAGRTQMLSHAPDPAGLVAAYCDELGGWHAKHAPAGEPVAAPWKRHMPHQATCQPPQDPAPGKDPQ